MPITIYSHNNYDSLCNCFDDFYSLIVGCFFPSILFGQTYEKSKFGNCFTGFMKMFLLYFIFSSLSILTNTNLEESLLFSKQNKYIKNFDNCKNDKLCKININLEDSCNFKNNTQICHCLQNSYSEYCDFNNNILPDILNQLMIYLFLLNTSQIIIYNIIIGLFSSYYRNKISYKLDIREKKWKSFCIHCCPLTHMLALCQEYKAVDKYNLLITPLNPVSLSTNFMV
tara:strand:+ start:1172 stop:1852 length:681 start_codon:yes stop_codon:yes gene_type:complete